MADAPVKWSVPIRKGSWEPLNDTIVITRSYDWYLTWCRYSHINPRSKKITWASRPEHLYGRETFDLVVYGGYPYGYGVDMREEVDRLRKMGVVGQEYSHFGDPSELRPFEI